MILEWNWTLKKCARLIMKNGKCETKERIELLNQKSIKTFGVKENYKHLGILEKIQSNKQRWKKRMTTKKNEKNSAYQTLLQKFHQRNKYMGCHPFKIVGTILKMNKGVIETNGPNDNKIDAYEQGLTSERWHRQIVCQEEESALRVTLRHQYKIKEERKTNPWRQWQLET